MTQAAARLPVILAGAILLAGALLLCNHTPEYCGRTWPGVHSLRMASTASLTVPTLAPPQKMVVVRVEADKSDLEIQWGEN